MNIGQPHIGIDMAKEKFDAFIPSQNDPATGKRLQFKNDLKGYKAIRDVARRIDAIVCVEADTLKGRQGGCVLFTLIFECGLMLAFHKERETAQTWTGIVNMLYRVAGRPLIMQLFPVILEDNGAPFSDPVMTENARARTTPTSSSRARRCSTAIRTARRRSRTSKGTTRRCDESSSRGTA